MCDKMWGCLPTILPRNTHATSSAVNRAVEREAGYLVIGALCRSGLGADVGGSGALEGSAGQLLGLLALAFGEDSGAELQQAWWVCEQCMQSVLCIEFCVDMAFVLVCCTDQVDEANPSYPIITR